MAHGARVTVSGRRPEVLAEAVKSLGGEGVASGVRGDVRSVEAAQAMVEAAVAHGGGRGLDVLVNCAAGNFLAAAEQLSTNGFRTVMEIDAVGTFNVSRAALPALRAAADAKRFAAGPLVLNISATLQSGATWWQTHASAAKSAVDSLTRSLALEWGAYGVRVCGLAPGPIADTAGWTKLSGDADMKDSSIAKAMVPLGRFGSVADIGSAAVFLSSDGASYVSGDVMIVDGAQWLVRPLPPPHMARDKVLSLSRAVEKKSRQTGRAKL